MDAYVLPILGFVVAALVIWAWRVSGRDDEPDEVADDRKPVSESPRPGQKRVR